MSRTEPAAVTDDAGLGALARTLRDARENLGWSLDEVVFRARTRYPNLRASRSKISRLEQGKIDPYRLDLFTVAALADLYGLRQSQLGIDAEISDMRRAVDALLRCCPDLPPEPPPSLQLAS